MESPKLLCLCWHHFSHSLTQYSVSCCVFLGTADTLVAVTAGCKWWLVSGHGGSYLLVSGRGCCCCCSNDSVAARRMRSISLWWSASLASSLLSHHPLRSCSVCRRDPWFFCSVFVICAVSVFGFRSINR